MTDAPLSRPPALRRYASDGTAYILAGTVVASLGAFLFQVVGGRALGPADFDPVTALLTVHFLVFTVLLLPVEQFEIRRITLGYTGGGGAVAAVAIGGAVLATAFTFGARDHFFHGEAMYALVGVVAVAGNTVLAIGRGRLAGQRRFRAYGLISALVAMVRVVMAVAIMAVAATGIGMGWALAIAPFLTLLWRPFRRGGATATRRGDAGRFLGGFVLASAASQVLLLAAPLAVRLLDDAPGLMSVVFVTFQLFRAPLVMVQNLLARVLPPLTNLAAVGEGRELRRWAVRFGMAGLVVAPVAAAGGAVLGPPVIRLLFGAEFVPAVSVAALAAAGMVLASVALLAGQVLVAEGRTLALAGAWAMGFVAAAMALLPALGGADVRVSTAFVAGEAAALGAIVAMALRPVRADR